MLQTKCLQVWSSDVARKCLPGPPGTCLAHLGPAWHQAGLLRATGEVAVYAETMRDVMLALSGFTPEFDGAVLTTEAVSLYFWCVVDPASLPPHLLKAVGECSKTC